MAAKNNCLVVKGASPLKYDLKPQPHTRLGRKGRKMFIGRVGLDKDSLGWVFEFQEVDVQLAWPSVISRSHVLTYIRLDTKSRQFPSSSLSQQSHKWPK